MVEKKSDRLELEHRAKLQYVLMARLFGINAEEDSPEAGEWMDEHNHTVSGLIDNNDTADEMSREIRRRSRLGTKAEYIGAAKLLFALLPKEIIPEEATNHGWPKEGDLGFLCA